MISGSASSAPISDQVPELIQAKSRPRGRDGRHGGAGVVAGRGDDRHGADARLFGHRPAAAAQHRAGRHDLGEDAGRDAQAFQQRRGPVAAARVVALGGGGVAELADRPPGQPVVEQVGHGQEGVGRVQRRATPLTTIDSNW